MLCVVICGVLLLWCVYYYYYYYFLSSSLFRSSALQRHLGPRVPYRRLRAKVEPTVNIVVPGLPLCICAQISIMSQKQQLLPSINENKPAVGTSIIVLEDKNKNGDSSTEKKSVELTNVEVNEDTQENNKDKSNALTTPQKSLKLLKSETEMKYKKWNSSETNDLITVMNTSGGQQTWKNYREKVKNILEIDGKLKKRREGDLTRCFNELQCRFITLLVIVTLVVLIIHLSTYLIQVSIPFKYDPELGSLTIRVRACDVRVSRVNKDDAKAHTIQVTQWSLSDTKVNANYAQSIDKDAVDGRYMFLQEKETMGLGGAAGTLLSYYKEQENEVITSLSVENDQGCDNPISIEHHGCHTQCLVNIYASEDKPINDLYIWQYEDDATPLVFANITAPGIVINSLTVEAKSIETHVNGIISTTLLNVTSVEGAIHIKNTSFTNAYLRSTRNSIYLIDTHKNSDQTNLAVHYRSTNELGCIQAVGMNPSTSSSSWLLHNEYSDRPGFRRGISCDPTGSNGDSGAARAVLNTFNPNKDVFISRDNVISGLANLKSVLEVHVHVLAIHNQWQI